MRNWESQTNDRGDDGVQSGVQCTNAHQTQKERLMTKMVGNVDMNAGF